jgi:hypothetical protein
VSDLERSLRDLIADLVREEVRRALADATQPGEFLTTADAAQVAKVAQGTIRRWIRDDRLLPRHAGRELRRWADPDALTHESGRGRRERTPEDLAEDFVRGSKALLAREVQSAGRRGGGGGPLVWRVSDPDRFLVGRAPLSRSSQGRDRER